jgi:hypothetical protein
VKPAEEYVYQYSVDPMSGLEQTQVLGEKHAEEMQLRLCQLDPNQGEPALASLTRGQDSPLCKGLVKDNTKPSRRPVVTPPANNHGVSEPPGGHKKVTLTKDAAKPDATPAKPAAAKDAPKAADKPAAPKADAVKPPAGPAKPDSGKPKGN